MRNVERDRRVFIFFELAKRSRTHHLLDEGLYPYAVRGTQLLARADDPSTPVYWAASTVEKREFGPVVPACLSVYCQGYDDVTQITRVRYRDEERTQLAAGYCLMGEHDGSAWVDLQDPWAWLSSMELVRYESPFEPDEVDTIYTAAEAADVPLTAQDEKDLAEALDLAIAAAYTRAGQTPSGLRSDLGVGAANVRYMARAE